MRWAALVLLCAHAALAQDHPIDDYFRMREETDRLRIESDRYRQERDDLMRQRDQDARRRDEYDSAQPLPPLRIPCSTARVVTPCEH